MVRLTVIEILILLAYLSLFVELVFFPVPSVASTHTLVTGKRDTHKKGWSYSIQRWSTTKKLLLLIIPSMLNLITFSLPILFLIFKDAYMELVPGIIPQTVFLTYPGIGLILLSRILSFRSVISIRTQSGLIRDGVFSFSRNPVGLGMMGTLTGLTLLFPNIIMFVGWLIFLTHMHFRIKIEEDYLKEKYGQAYRNYMKTTRRYF